MSGLGGGGAGGGGECVRFGGYRVVTVLGISKLILT